MKRSKILIGLLAFGLLVTGCGQKSPEDALKKAFEETNKAESLKVDMDVTAEVKSGSMSVSVNGKVGVEGKFTDDVTNAHFTMDFSLGEEKLDIDMYAIQNDGKDVVSYLGMNEQWFKMSLDNEDIEDEEESSDFDIKFKEVKKVSSKDGITVYEATIAKEQIKDLMKDVDMSQIAEMGLSDFSYDFDDVVVKFSVNNKNIITKVEGDLPIAFSVAVQEEKTDFTVTLKVVAELSKYNEVNDIKVPEEAIENAVDMMEFTIQQYATSYASEIGWDVWEHPEKDNKQYTDTTLDYGGPAPTKVDVLLEDGEVVSGIIEIEGYTATFENDEMISFKKNQ